MILFVFVEDLSHVTITIVVTIDSLMGTLIIQQAVCKIRVVLFLKRRLLHVFPVNYHKIAEVFVRQVEFGWVFNNLRTHRWLHVERFSCPQGFNEST